MRKRSNEDNNAVAVSRGVQKILPDHTIISPFRVALRSCEDKNCRAVELVVVDLTLSLDP